MKETLGYVKHRAIDILGLAVRQGQVTPDYRLTKLLHPARL